MLNEALNSSGDRPPSSSSRKSTTLTTVNKILKSKIPTTQFGRSAIQSGSVHSSMHEESSSGITSNNISSRRATMKTLAAPSSNKKPLIVAPAEKRQLEIQYGTKKIRYTNLRKTLVDKQKTAQDLYNEISCLREKIIAAGGKDPGKIEELKSPQVECYPKQRLPTPIETSLLHDYSEQREQICMNESVVMSITLLQNQLQELFDRSQEFCQRTLDKNTMFAALIKSWLTGSTLDEMGNASVLVDLELKAQLPIFEQENEDLGKQLNELRMAQDDIVIEFAKRSSSLRNEYENYRGCTKERPNVDQKDMQDQLSVALEELQAERDKTNQEKDKTKMMELQVQKARTKIRELQGHVTNEEIKSQQLQNNVKLLEAQMKQKDQTMELRIKDMQKAIKSSETLVAKIEKQRDTLESRLQELREKMISKESETNAVIKEISEKFEITEKKNTDMINEEREKRHQAESALAEMEKRCKHLEEKSQLLCDLANEKSNNLTVADDNHTENEVRLYNDLKVTRAELEKQMEKIEQLEKEKQEIVAVMHQAASRDNEDETRDKLAAELVAKTNDLQKLMLEHAQIQKVARFAQERNEVLENQLAEIQRNLHARSKEGAKMGVDPHTIELQQEISDLRNSLADIIQQNQQMERTLTQKQLELEQRDRMMREQSKFLKVRDELQNLLKGKQHMDNQSNRDDEEIDEISKQITEKTEAIQELYTTLEGKQMQVMRLEKLVKLLEDQQDRAQAQRTRLEYRIAQLEISLREKTKNGNRYVMRRYLRKPHSNIVEDKPSRAFRSESKEVLLGSSASLLQLFNPRSRQKSGFSRHRQRHISSMKSPDPPARTIGTSKFDRQTKFRAVHDSYQAPYDKEEVFICEQCRREARKKYKNNIVYQTRRNHCDRNRDPHYSWLMETSALEAFGEPMNRLNYFNDGLSSFSGSQSEKEDTDCFFRINPYVIGGNREDRSRESRRQCRQYRQYRFLRRSRSASFQPYQSDRKT